MSTFSFGTIKLVEKFIEVKKIVEEYIARAKMQRDGRVKLLKVEIKDKYINYELGGSVHPACVLINKRNKQSWSNREVLQ